MNEAQPQLPETMRPGAVNQLTPAQIAQHGWTVVDSYGAAMDIDKHKLRVDQSYQRDSVKPQKVLELARAWSWIACNSITVGLRDDGTYWVLDGQHRLLAALKRPDITKLPCRVFRVKSTKQEAEAFLRTNTNRKPISALDRHKARLTAEDDISQAIESTLAATGYKLSDNGSSHTVRCATALHAMWRRDPELAEKTWTLVAAIYKGALVKELVLTGLFHVAIKCDQLFETKTIDRLIAIGPEILLTEINRMVAINGRGTPSVYAAAIAQAHNKGQRRGKLTWSAMLED